MARIFADVKGAGVLDFVTAWYRKAAAYMAENPAIKSAFVSTNSITQGEQVGVLWADLLKRGVKIHFAHRTFQWSSEARGKAAVQCVIIGFALRDCVEKVIFDYENPKAEALGVQVQNINPYLVDAPSFLLSKRNKPICDAPEISYGSFALDDGNYTLSDAEYHAILQESQSAKQLMRPFVGGQELLHNEVRYCIWLKNASPNEINCSPSILKRVEAVQKWRRSSNRQTTMKLASTPTIFAEIRQPDSNYLAFPTLSSERRPYIPLTFLHRDTIASNQVYVIRHATIFHFGILSSAMHMAWVRSVCGRLESRYRYSAGIVYNNFPWPQGITDKQRQAVEAAAQGVLEARANYPDSSLAALYDPLTMPPELVKAHRKLDAAVDAAYGKRKFTGDRDRLALLFELYQQILSPLSAKKNLRRK